jgi:thioesterase domain-containing protein
MLSIDPAALRGLSLDDQLRRVLAQAERDGSELYFSDLEGGRRLIAAWHNNFDAMYRYTAPPWPDGEVQFFAAAERDDQLAARFELAWIGRCAVRVEVTPGDHQTMVMPPHASALGARIRRCIDASTPWAAPAVRGPLAATRSITS